MKDLSGKHRRLCGFYSAVLASVTIFVLFSFSGCNESGGFVSSLAKVSVSDILETELPCVNAEELYERQRFSVPPELLTRYGLPSGFDGTNLYFLRDNVPASENKRSSPSNSSRTALIAYYNVEKCEIVTLFEEDSTDCIFYNLAGVYDSCIYYFRGEGKENHDRATTQLYRLSLYSKQPEMIIDFEMPHQPSKAAFNAFCAAGRYIFFSDGRIDNVDGEAVIRYVVYRYNTQNGQIEEFINDAKDPVPYKDGIAYFRERETELEIHYLDLQSGEDKVITEPFENIVNGTGYSGGGDIFVETFFNDENDISGTAIGYIDFDGVKSIAVIPAGSFVQSISGNEMLLLEIGGGQLIYDSENQCFAKLNINREYTTGYASDNSALFLCYDNSFANTVIYVYTQRGDIEEKL